jgi:hypothetical protein
MTRLATSSGVARVKEPCSGAELLAAALLADDVALVLS